MNNQHNEAVAVAAKITAYLLAWLGSWKLAEIQAVAGIFSALMVGLVALVNLWLLWRDKIRNHK